jgi:hypothetical protein
MDRQDGGKDGGAAGVRPAAQPARRWSWAGRLARDYPAREHWRPGLDARPVHREQWLRERWLSRRSGKGLLALARTRARL